MEKVIALLPWDITVRRARTRKQAHELLERNDADEAIRALTETEAYYAVKELGVDGALPFLAVIEPRQITALFDLDTWHGERPDLSDLLVWLMAFKEASPEQLSRAARAMDPELLALLLRRRLLIALNPANAGEEEPPANLPQWLVHPPDEIQPLIETPDRRFTIAARAYDEDAGDEPEPVDEEEKKAVLDLVDALYKDPDFDLIAGALHAAEADLSSGLEEAALHFRTGRLEDLGFPSFEAAQRIYAPLDPREITGPRSSEAMPEAELMLPAIHAQQLAQGLFQEVLRTIESTEIVHRIEGDLVALANTALVADRVEPGDLDRLREVLDRMRAYLELALAYDAPPGRAVEIGRARLETHPLRTLFRAGFGITVELARRAGRIRSGGAFAVNKARTLELLSVAERLSLEALLQPRPLFPRVLEDARLPPDDFRPFRTEVDVDRAKRMLEDLEALEVFARDRDLAGRNARLEGALDPPETMERDIDMLLTTMAAWAILGRGFVLAPLGADDLLALCARLEGGAFPAALVDRALAEARIKSSIEKRVRRGLGNLQEALSPLVGASEIDPRYVGVVVRRVG